MKPKLVFYADDFTGATDALEFMASAGARTVLFLDVPSPKELEVFGDLDAIGIASRTRAMVPEQMRLCLEEDFAKIAVIDPEHVHYKVCSTFDSSPEIGNIGVAITQGILQFKNDFVPVVVAAPDLGRYVVFGQLFAQMGIGSSGEVYRIDRHPSMSKHPVTPAKEADLRDHLALQAEFKTGLIDIRDLEERLDELFSKVNALSKNHEVIFFDGLFTRQMETIGGVLENSKSPGKPMFSVGSSGVEQALGAYWQLGNKSDWQSLKKVEALLVLCGSVSPITAQQIDYAVDAGFIEVAIDPNFLNENLHMAVEHYTEQILEFLKQGKSVIIHTAKGPQDIRLEAVKRITQNLGWDEVKSKTELPKRFGELLGLVAKTVLSAHALQRLVIAGGDTSSYTARAMGIDAVEMIAPLVKGAPLCRIHSKNSAIDGLQINLKGGQLGENDYFVALKNGT